jgi:hypothetical protein
MREQSRETAQEGKKRKEREKKKKRSEKEGVKNKVKRRRERNGVLYPSAGSHRMLSDAFMQYLTVPSCLHALHENHLSSHEWQLQIQMSPDNGRPYLLCYVMLCYVMLCYVMLSYGMLCYVILRYVILCYVM